MRKLSEIMRENRTAKRARIAARPPKKPDINSRLMALMLLPNERIQQMIVEGTSSTYVPLPKGNHSIMSGIDQYRKQQKRLASWTGQRT